MKKCFLYMMGVVLLAGLFSACSEEELDTFEVNSKAGIYIQKVAITTITGVPIEYTDSVFISFVSTTGDFSTVQVPVRIMGLPVDYDRSFVLKVDKEKSTAVEGEHFEVDMTKCVIPANAVSVNVPVTLFRHNDLAQKALRVELYLEANDQFDVELEEYKNKADWTENGEMLSGKRFKINFSDQYAPTTWWSLNGVEFFGAWSATKEKKVNSVLGWTHFDWMNWNIPYSHMPYVAKQLRKELQSLADAGTPLIDDNGKPMQLGSKYLVDYSAYE